MIKGFETETQPLNDYEKNTLLPVFVTGLLKRKGKANAITNVEMVKAMKNSGYDVSDARVRKIINHIRINGLVLGLIGTSSGYYVATTERELVDYEESLKGREDAIRAVRESMVRQRREMFKPVQASLFGK